LEEMNEELILKCLSHRLNSESGMVSALFEESPGKNDQLVSFWKTYSGPDAVMFLDVLLVMTALGAGGETLSSFIVDVLDSGDEKIRHLAHYFIQEDPRWEEEFNQIAKESLAIFFASREQDELFILAYLGLVPGILGLGLGILRRFPVVSLHV
jgi:hypothetical protein